MRLLGKRKQEVGRPTESGDLSEYSLEELFEEAEALGRVRLALMETGNWICVIEFQTIADMVLKAEAGFGTTNPDGRTKRTALMAAIAKGKEIKAQFK